MSRRGDWHGVGKHRPGKHKSGGSRKGSGCLISFMIILGVLLVMGAKCGDQGEVRKTGPGVGQPFKRAGTITVLAISTCKELHLVIKGTSPDGHVERYERNYHNFDWVHHDSYEFSYTANASLTVTMDATAEPRRPGVDDCTFQSWIYDTQKPGPPVSMVDKKIISYSRSFFMKYTRIPA